MRILRSLLILCPPFAQAFVTNKISNRHGTEKVALQFTSISHPLAWKERRYHDQPRLCSVSLHGASNDNEHKQQDNSNSIKSRTKNLSKIYRMASYMFGFMGAVLLVMPDHTVNTMVSSKLGGAAGYGIASGLCYILQGATNHDRLKSVTYKRLNIGLLGFSLMSLAAVPGEAGFLPTFVPALLLSLVATIVRLLGAFAAYSGWVQGLGGKASPRTLIQDFAQDTKETLLGLRVKHKGALFRNAFVLVSIAGVSSLLDGIFNVRYASHLAIGAFEISLHWSAVARLFMISTIIYSLKDAAERDRLQGTTFIQLNVMVGIWAFLVGIGQTVYPLGFAPKRGAIMFAFAVPFILSALVNTRLKSDKASPRIK